MSSDEEPEEGARTDLEKVGMFRDGPYDTDVTLFRPDIKALMGRDPGEEEQELRLGLGTFLTTGHKIKAATNDWTFDEEFKSVWVTEEDGEPAEYEDPGAWKRRQRMEDAEKNISEEPFKSMVGPKDMNGSGTYYGTFWELDEEPLEAFSPEVRDKEDHEEAPPNFYTSPGKKGTGYGYLDVTLNPYPEHDEDMEDPYFDVTEARREEREAHEEKIVGDGAFIPSGYPQDFFDPNPYYNDRDPDGEEETYDFDRLFVDNEELNGDRPPWIPPSKTKKINGNKDVMVPFERWPETEEDFENPYEDPPRNIFRQFEPDEEKPAWRPNIHKKTRQQRSIIGYNVNLRVNSTNFHRYL